MQIFDFRFVSLRSKIFNLKSRKAVSDTPLPHPRTRTPVHYCILGLVGDEVREKVGENSKQRQPRQTVCREYPCSAAFMLDRGRCGRRLVGGRDNRGPIFHAQTSSGKIVAQVIHASRLHGVAALQDLLTRILPRFLEVRTAKRDQNHIIMG